MRLLPLVASSGLGEQTSRGVVGGWGGESRGWGGKKKPGGGGGGGLRARGRSDFR